MKDLSREKNRSNDKRALEGRLINQMQLLNAERAKISNLNRQIEGLQRQLKAAEDHSEKLASLLAKFH